MLLLFVIVFILIIYFAIRCENRKFRITEYKYKTDKVKRTITIAVLSDLHNYSYGEDNSELLKAVDSVKPDYVISSGDMIEGSDYAKGTRNTIAFLGKICEKYPFVYGCGNHEWRILKYSHRKNRDKIRGELLEAIGQEAERLEKIDKKRAEYIKPLDNENVLLENDEIMVYGLNLEKDYFKKFKLNKVNKEHITELIGEADEKKLNILIGHNPEQFDAYAKWGADIVLAGHNHGGMVATPWHRGMISPRFMPFPKYDWGEYKMKNTTMFLSRGLGNHTIHVRIFNRAELMVVKINPSEEK